MAITYDVPGSSDASVAIKTGTTTYQYPQRAEGSTTLVKVGYTFVINRDDFYLTALSTADPLSGSYYLIEETVPADSGAGLVQWQRWYGTVPSAYSTYTSEAVTFPGYYDSYDTDTNFRPPYTLVVSVEERHDFLKTSDPVTDFPVAHYQQKELHMNARGEYVDYVDDNTTVQPVGGSQTYTEYLALVAAGTVIYIREPIVRRAYGTGEIWEMITFRTPAL